MESKYRRFCSLIRDNNFIGLFIFRYSCSKRELSEYQSEWDSQFKNNNKRFHFMLYLKGKKQFIKTLKRLCHLSKNCEDMIFYSLARFSDDELMFIASRLNQSTYQVLKNHINI